MNDPASSSNDKVLVLKNAQGDHFAIPLHKLDDGKLRNAVERSAADAEAEGAGFEVVGVVHMPQEHRKGAYMKPTVSTNFEIDMPTS